MEAALNKHPFGTLKTGTAITEYALTNPNRIQVRVIPFGGIITAGRFSLGDQTFQLAVNDGPNHLHGGLQGFDKRLWDVVREFSGPNRDRMHLTGEEGFVGTPWFMPPEAIKSSARSDPRSDIYSVGALAYYLLSGKYVFEGSSVMEIYEKQLTTPVIPPSKRTTNLVSPQLDETILRCLEKEPGRRPQSAGELRQLLLESPLAYSWGPDLRASWWAEYRKLETEHAAKPASAPSSPMPTVKVDVASRIE